MSLQIGNGTDTAAALAKEFGTPLYVTDARIVTENVQQIRQAFQSEWAGPVRVLPAIKAATSIGLLMKIKPVVDGCDLFSEGEYEVARRAGFAPETMSINGNSKIANTAFLDRLVRDGVRITIDDIGEIEAIEQAAQRVGVKASVRLRMRPSLDRFWSPTDFFIEPLPTYIADQAYKSGFPTQDLLEAGRRILASPHFILTGLHTHFARHKSTPAYWRAAGRALAQESLRCLEAWDGWTPKEIDLGGGFAGPGDQVGKESSFGFALETMALQSLRILPRKLRDAAAAKAFEKSRRQTPEDVDAEAPSSFSDQAHAMVGALVAGLAGRIDASQVTLEIEPGRGIFTNAGSHIARVLGVKRQIAPIPWTLVVTDSSTGFLSDAETELCRFRVRVEPTHAASGTEIVDVTGISCNADRIVGDVRVPKGIEKDDLIVFDGTGAYNEQAGTNFNSLPRPASVILDDGAALIRRRETIDDVLARDIIPPDTATPGVENSAPSTPSEHS